MGKEGEIVGAPELDEFAYDAAFALVDCASGPAFAIDRSLTIVDWNRAVAQCLGYVAEEVIGQHCSDVLQAVHAHGEPLCGPSCEGVWCFRRSNPFVAAASYARHKNGGWVPVNLTTVVTSKRVQSSDNRSVLAVIFLRGASRLRRSFGRSIRLRRADPCHALGRAVGHRGRRCESMLSPAKRAREPSSASMRSRRLNLAVRSPRAGAPLLI